MCLANGLIFVSYMTGIVKRYGESTGKICLSVFPPSQPENIRYRTIDIGVGESRGLLCNAHYFVGDGKNRILFTIARGELGTYYRDYDFYTDTISERTEVFLRTEEGDVRLNNTTYMEYLEKCGFHIETTRAPI